MRFYYIYSYKIRSTIRRGVHFSCHCLKYHLNSSVIAQHSFFGQTECNLSTSLPRIKFLLSRNLNDNDKSLKVKVIRVRGKHKLH